MVVALGIGLLIGRDVLWQSAEDAGERAGLWVDATPGHTLLDTYACPAGTFKHIDMLGVEDQLDRGNVEVSRMSDTFASFAVHKGRFDRRGQAYGSRDYDEAGPDKHHYDAFDVPAGFRQGRLVIGVQLREGSDRDGLGIYVDEVAAKLGERDDTLLARNAAAGIATIQNLQSAHIGERGYTVLTQALGSMVSPGNVDAAGAGWTFEDYLDAHLPGRPAMTLSVVIGDDTPVDFIGLASCHEFAERRGMTWASSDILRADTGLHAMSCNFDLSRAYCDERSGDLLCSVSAPLACYRDGTRTPPTNPTHQLRIDANFSGGDIRLTEPVRGDGYESVDDAAQACRDAFGAQWSVLDHHVAGGGLALTYSDIPHGARAWVNIRTAPEATCWGQ